MKKILFIALALAAPWIGSAQNGKPAAAPQLGVNTVEEVIAAMTPEEKVRMVVGMGFKIPAPPTPKKKEGEKGDPTAEVLGIQLPRTNAEDDLIAEKVPGAAGRLHGIPRLGIPIVTVSDGPAGLRIEPMRPGNPGKTYYATAFPTGTLLASSWDTTLVRKVGVAFGEEIRDYGVDVLLAPGMNTHRNPLGGRNFEYYSEDPVVSGNMAAAIVNGIQSQGVGTTIKHFAANNQETNRASVNTVVSERAMREIYLKGFEIAVKKSDPWAVMSSYNKINGVYAPENRALLTTILKDEWKYKGMVMTDWFGGKDAVAMINAGNDLLMPGNAAQSEAVLAGLKSGRISVRQIDDNVRRVLNLVLKSPTFKKFAYSDAPDLKGHAEVARMAAAEGMVLLKNLDNTLPLKPGAKVAFYGNTTFEIIAGGTGSGDVNKAYVVSLYDGLKNAGFALDENWRITYQTFIADERTKRPKPKFFFQAPEPIPEMTLTPEQLKQHAADADIAVLTIGRNAGEGADRKVENDFNLSAVERKLMENIVDAYHAKGKRVVVVLNIGGVIETASWRDVCDGILLAWQPGQEAGAAIADVLSGKVNPSGKLATTFPISYTDDPSAKNFPGKEFPQSAGTPSNPMMGRPAEVVYEEDIYVGYRYNSTFHAAAAYPFGFGGSYTTFIYGNLVVESIDRDNNVSLLLSVKNTGQAAGKEVVQCYLTAPAGLLNKPALELKGFAKTNLLQPGESQTLRFTMSAADLASYDPERSAWVADAGTYTVKIGASSTDIKKTASFTLAKDAVTERVHPVLKPAVQIAQLKPN